MGKFKPGDIVRVNKEVSSTFCTDDETPNIYEVTVTGSGKHKDTFAGIVTKMIEINKPSVNREVGHTSESWSNICFYKVHSYEDYLPRIWKI